MRHDYDHSDECAANRRCEECDGKGGMQDEDGEVLACPECKGEGHLPCDCYIDPDYESMAEDRAYEREHRYDGPRLDFWQDCGGGKW